jgi:hypothetical protein
VAGGLAGGKISDRLLHRGMGNARVVVPMAAVLASVPLLALVARTVADDLDRPHVSRAVRSSPARTEPPRHDRPTPGTGSLRSEVEDIQAALAGLAQMRGLAMPEVATSEVPSR